MLRDIPYKKPLGNELAPFHAYVIDSGYSLMAIPRSLLDKAREDGHPDQYEVPVPVKYVLAKGYELIDGHLVVDAPYDSFLGLNVGEEWSEY